MCASSLEPGRYIERGPQLWLLIAPSESSPETTRQRVMPFRDPDPAEIYVNGRRLDEHLKHIGYGETRLIREVLRSLDWEVFRARYQRNGRPPYAPEAMMSGILFGLMKGLRSLRKLEYFFKTNHEVWWLTGGIAPDHAALGRFVHMHAESLSEDFFTMLTSKILDVVGKKAGKKVTVLDGTVIAAAGSRLACRRVKKVVQIAEAARAAADAAPDDKAAQQAAEKAERVLAAGQARQKARAAAGDSTDKLAKMRVCTTEPDAVILKSKTGQVEPAYIPSVLAGEDVYIVGQSVEQTDEKAAFPKVIKQASAIGVEVEVVLADGNYCKGDLLQHAVAEDINVITPPDKASKSGRKKELEPLASNTRNVVKQDFTYKSESDTYTCPRGVSLYNSKESRTDKRRGSEADVYRPEPSTCDGCAFKARCKFSSRGVERQASEPYIEAMRDVLRQPQAQEIFARRGVIVEPCFSVLKCAMGIQRFHRFGYKSVQVEFALYVCAYNLIKMTRAVRRERLKAARPSGAPSDSAGQRELLDMLMLAFMLAAIVRLWLAHP